MVKFDKGYDVVIVGGGLGGLACGAILSRAGQKVLVLERGAQVGGCIQSYWRGGLTYDTGFHYVGGLGEGQSLRPLFDHLGLISLPWHQLDPDGFDHVMIGSHNYLLANGFDRFVDRLAEDFPSERRALERYADMLQAIGREETQTNAADPMRSMLIGGIDPMRSKLIGGVDPMRLMQTSAYRYLTETFSDPLLINVLSGASMRLELRCESLPLFTFAHCNAPFIESSWRLRGDGGQIVGSLAESIRRNGGEIRCLSEVSELVENGGRITAARCRNGATFEGRAFISSLHPATTCRLVSSGLKDTFRRRILSLSDTCGMLSVSLRLKPMRVPYFNYNQYIYRKPNVWTFADDVGGVGGVMVSCRLPEKLRTGDGMMGRMGDGIGLKGDGIGLKGDGMEQKGDGIGLKGDGMGQKGKMPPSQKGGGLSDAKGVWAEQIDLLAPVNLRMWEPWSHSTHGRRPMAYEQLKRQLADECILLAERFIPGLSEKYDLRYISTPLTYRDYTATPAGSAFGLRKDYRSSLLTMLSPRTPLSNLLLTGQSLMLHGLQGVVRTAFDTCAEILGRDYIHQILTK